MVTTMRTTDDATSNTVITTTTTTRLGVIEPFLREEEDDDDDDKSSSPSCLSASSHDGSVSTDGDCASCMSLPRSYQGALYGREGETHQLLQAFERCCRTHDTGTADFYEATVDAAAATAATSTTSENHHFELVLLTGASGTGKTSMAKEILKPEVKAKGGFFAVGKFDQLKRSAPYYPIRQALRELVQQVLHWDDDDDNDEEHHGRPGNNALGNTRATVREEIQRVVDPIVASEPLLLDIFHPLKAIMSADTVAAVSNEENIICNPSTEHRLLEALAKLLRAVSSTTRPLVLFLDDLQWADEACLNLLSVLVSHDNGSVEGNSNAGLMVLGACRGNEVSVDDELSVTLREMEEELCVRITDIRLCNLQAGDVYSMLSDFVTDDVPMDRASTLVSFILEQTSGNPLFARQLLIALDDEGWLDLDIETDLYMWEMDDRASFGLSRILRSDSAVRLLTRRIRAQLSTKVRRMLVLAACLGAEFEQDILEDLTGRRDVQKLLWKAKQKNLISCVKSSGSDATIWRFNHDVIQQACYGLIPEQNRERTHLDIGWSLFQTLSSEKLDTHLNSIMDQINRGVTHIQSPEDREKVSFLCLQAGEQAMRASAFRTAADRFHLAIRLLGKRHWRDQYHLSLDIWCAAAEVEYCNGNFQACDNLIAQVLDNAVCFDDCLRSYTTKVYSLGSRAELVEAIELGTMVLEKGLDESFPKEPRRYHIVFELLKTKRMLSKLSDADIMALPKMEESNKVVAMRMISLMSVYACALVSPLFPLLVMRLVQLTIRYGRSALTAPVFALWGLLLCNGVKDIESGLRYARLGLTLLTESSTGEWQSRVQVFSHGFCLIWADPLCDQLEPLQQSHEAGLRTGDIECAVLASCAYSRIALHVSKQLPQLVGEMEIALDEATRLKQDIHAHFLRPLLQLALNLLGRSPDPCVLTGDAMDEDEAIRIATNTKNTSIHAVILCSKLMLCYLFGRIDEAERLSKLVDKECKTDAFSSLALGDMYLYQSLAALAACTSSSSSRRQGIRRARQKLKKLKWIAKLNPNTFQSQVLLVQGEIAAVRGQPFQAVRIFDQAVTCARKDRVLGEIALGRERAAVALEQAISASKSTSASSVSKSGPSALEATRDASANASSEYWNQAIAAYTFWGATAKVDQIKRRLLERQVR